MSPFWNDPSEWYEISRHIKFNSALVLFKKKILDRENNLKSLENLKLKTCQEIKN